MGPKQAMSQQQKQLQKLVMTQQLQQSIQMLQFNVDGLQKFLQQKSLENPLIEVQTTLEHVPVIRNTSSRQVTDPMQYMDAIPERSQSLFEYLLDQVHLTMRATPLRDLVLFLLEYLDLNGYLKLTLEEAMAKTGASQVQVLDALTLLQQLDPPGVGARDLQECLLLQIENDDRAPAQAYLVLEDSFLDFAQRHWDKISQRYHMSLAQVQAIFDYVQGLTPHPGASFTQSQNDYIIPDLILEMAGPKLKLMPTKAGRPKLRFQQKYFERMAQSDDQAVAKYLQEKKQEYAWLKNSLQQRGSTILRVGQSILKHQHDFFTQATHPLKPLLLRDVAQELKLHESTISRSVNGKYLQTPFGVYELRQFFTNAVNQENGDAFSAENVKQQLAQLIAAEDKQHPLSDQKIVTQLAAQGITISRRTAAKYREALGIQSSSKRKRYE